LLDAVSGGSAALGDAVGVSRTVVALALRAKLTCDEAEDGGALLGPEEAALAALLKYVQDALRPAPASVARPPPQEVAAAEDEAPEFME
jgi:hypothetical protein